MADESTGIRYSIRVQLAALCCALRFLTVLPISWCAEKDGELFTRSVYGFVPVGAIIGLFGMLLTSVAGMALPGAVVALVLVFYLGAISGFLHLDGLADSGDGLLSHRSREKSLEIMKDSRIGAMGVIVLIFTLGGKCVALSTLPQPCLGLAAFCLPLAGRCAIVITMAMHRYARQEGGLGSLFYSPDTRRAALLGIAVMVFLLAAFVQWRIALITGLATAAIALWFGRFCRNRLGGVTGDTLGAVCELTELAVAIGLTVVCRMA